MSLRHRMRSLQRDEAARSEAGKAGARCLQVRVCCLALPLYAWRVVAARFEHARGIPACQGEYSAPALEDTDHRPEPPRFRDPKLSDNLFDNPTPQSDGVSVHFGGRHPRRYMNQRERSDAPVRSFAPKGSGFLIAHHEGGLARPASRSLLPYPNKEFLG